MYLTVLCQYAAMCVKKLGDEAKSKFIVKRTVFTNGKKQAGGNAPNLISWCVRMDTSSLLRPLVIARARRMYASNVTYLRAYPHVRVHAGPVCRSF